MSQLRYDYSDPAVMRQRAAVQQARRGSPQLYPYVVGRFVLDDAGRVILAGLQSHAGAVGGLTVDSRLMYRWRTRQGAWKWLREHPKTGDLAVWFLDRLDVAAGFTVGQPAGGLTDCQPARLNIETVQDAVRFLARTPADEEWILKLPLTYRVCLRAAESRLAVPGSSGEPPDDWDRFYQAKALLDAFHAERVRR